MKYLPHFLLALSLLSSSSLFAAQALLTEVKLQPITVLAGGKTQAELSLKPIQDYVRSRWNINCQIPNPSANKVVMQFGITMVKYAAWPNITLNGKSIGGIMGNPQGSLNPGSNVYSLEEVDNIGFNTLTFVNFDDSQNVTVECSAIPSTKSTA